MSIPVAIIASILAVLLTHAFASLRFKNELRIKRQEKIINDAKELASDFERKIFSRLHLTRDYLYEMQRAKAKSKEMDSDFRHEYKEMIKDWNLNLDYTSSFMLRNNMIKKINSLDELQAKFKEYHTFFYFHADELQKTKNEDIEKRLKSLSELQAYCYRFMQNINHNIDNKWDELLNKRGWFLKLLNVSIDYIIKTLVIYLAINMILFLVGPLFL